MDYYEFQFQTNEPDTLLAMLADLPMESFEYNEGGFSGYAAQQHAKTVEQALKNDFPDVVFTKIHHPAQNWNEVWESNFHPLLVEDFCGVRANFHPPLEGVDIELVITPKMAFGTGHHQTTYMMMQAMRHLPFYEKFVLDYGCGSGILSILAAHVGAKRIHAIDIQWEAYESTQENATVNGVEEAVESYYGTLHAIMPEKYDIILANINRNVLLESFELLAERLVSGGILLLSGILDTDEEIITNGAKIAGFTTVHRMQKDQWLCLQMTLS